VLSGAGLLARTWVALEQVDPDIGFAMRSRSPSICRFRCRETRRDTRRPTICTTTSARSKTRSANDHRSRESPGAARIRSTGCGFGQPFDVAGDPVKPDGVKDAASYHMVSPSYFSALGTPIVKGRGFANTDSSDAPPVCIVSEAFARQYLHGRSPLGLRIAVPLMAFGPPQVITRQIVGVAGQLKAEPGEPMPHAQIYVPLAQNAWWSASLIVRPRQGPAAALLPLVRAAIAPSGGRSPALYVRVEPPHVNVISPSTITCAVSTGCV
jgi:hypothetical protein